MSEKLFPISEKEIATIYELNGTNSDKLKNDVTILEEWYKQVPHFPESFQFGHFLLRCLELNKFSIESTKKKIEKYLTSKSLRKELYETFMPQEIILPSENICTFLPLPNLGPGNQRIYFGKFKADQNMEALTEHSLFLGISSLELGFRFDRTVRIIVVLDCKNANVDLLKYFNLPLTVRMISLALNAYIPEVVEEFHILNVTKPIRIFFSYLQRFVKHKFFDIFHLHNDLETLSLPIKYLPEEYGGAQGSLQEIMCYMDSAIIENEQYLRSLTKFASDESARVGKDENNACKQNVFGIEGTFKKLNID